MQNKNFCKTRSFFKTVTKFFKKRKKNWTFFQNLNFIKTRFFLAAKLEGGPLTIYQFVVPAFQFTQFLLFCPLRLIYIFASSPFWDFDLLCPLSKQTFSKPELRTFSKPKLQQTGTSFYDFFKISNWMYLIKIIKIIYILPLNRHHCLSLS